MTEPKTEESNPFSAFLGMLGQLPQERGDSTTQATMETQTGLLGITAGRPQRSQSPQREAPYPENLELLRKFIRPDGKIITEEDSEDLEEAINEQLKAHKQVESSEDEDSGSDIEDKTRIKDDPELTAKLTPAQKAQLLKLRDDVYQKGALESSYKAIADVVNSQFFNGLSPRSRDHFRLLNLHIFDA